MAKQKRYTVDYAGGLWRVIAPSGQVQDLHPSQALAQRQADHLNEVIIDRQVEGPATRIISPAEERAQPAPFVPDRPEGKPQEARPRPRTPPGTEYARNVFQGPLPKEDSDETQVLKREDVKAAQAQQTKSGKPGTDDLLRELIQTLKKPRPRQERAPKQRWVQGVDRAFGKGGGIGGAIRAFIMARGAGFGTKTAAMAGAARFFGPTVAQIAATARRQTAGAGLQGEDAAHGGGVGGPPGVGGAAAGAAGEGGGMTGLMGVAAIGSMTLAAWGAGKAIARWTENVVESNRTMAEAGSPSMRALFAFKDIADRIREINRGEATFPGAKRVVAAEQAFLDAWDPVQRDLINTFNELATVAAKVGTGFANLITAPSKWGREVDKWLEGLTGLPFVEKKPEDLQTIGAGEWLFGVSRDAAKQDAKNLPGDRIDNLRPGGGAQPDPVFGAF